MRDLCFQYLVQHAETVLQSQDHHGAFWADFGFETELPTVYHQYVHYPLAVLYVTDREDNPYFEDERPLFNCARALPRGCRAPPPTAPG